MPSITPFLWYDTQAEEAMNFYASIFKRSKIIAVNKIGGRTIGVEFELEGQRFMALNGGPKYTFNESYSMYVACETQAEIDHLWEKLTADGGGPTRCGWLQDKYGLSWQIIPRNLGKMMSDPDPAKAKRVLDVVLNSDKLDMGELQRAYDGK